jgi:chemotaxis protein CheZ
MMAPASARALRETVPAETDEASTDASQKLIVQELAAVAEYIGRLKQEIAALRVHELCGDRIPKAHEELGSVVEATSFATNHIMNAAEEILTASEESPEHYRSRVEAKVLSIFEACSFQDITGQRIAKVVAALAQLEGRLGRFATAVNVREAAAPSEEEAALLARRTALMLNGPAANGQAIGQDEIDRLFG